MMHGDIRTLVPKTDETGDPDAIMARLPRLYGDDIAVALDALVYLAASARDPVDFDFATHVARQIGTFDRWKAAFPAVEDPYVHVHSHEFRVVLCRALRKRYPAARSGKPLTPPA